jgi:hypothetical protein
MKNDSHAHRTYTRQEIADWITRYRASGLGLEAFASKHGLPRSRLHYWIYGQRRTHLGQPNAAPAVFQELKLATGLAVSPWAVEIRLPAGPVVRFSAAASPAWMSAVVQALHRPC